MGLTRLVPAGLWLFVVLAVVGSVRAEQAIVPQICWPGECLDQRWLPGGRSAVGIFRYPVPALVTWSTKRWEVLSYRPIKEIADPGLIRSACFSPDGRHMALNVDSEGVRVLETATVREILRLPGATAGFAQAGHTLIELLPDAIRFWNVDRLEAVRTLHIKGSDVSLAEISPDGRLLFTYDTDGKGRLWDARTGSLLRALKHDAPLLGPALFSPDSRYLVVNGDDPEWEAPAFAASEAAYGRTYELLLWDTGTGRLVWRRLDHDSLQGGTSSFFFVDSGRRLLSCGLFSIDVWAIPEGRCIRSFHGSGRMLQSSPGNAHRGPQPPFAVSPEGTQLAAGPERWALPSFKEIAALPMYQPSANWLAFSPDGTRLAAITPSDVAAVWDLREMRVTHWVQPSWWSSDTRIAFPSAGKIVAYTYGNHMEVHSALSGKLVNRLSPPSRIGRANGWTRLSPDGRLLAGDFTTEEDRHLEVWDAVTGATLARIAPCPHAAREYAFSSDRRWFVAQAGYGESTLYDLVEKTSRQLAGIVGQFAFSPDGSLLACYAVHGEGKPGTSLVLVATSSGEIDCVIGRSDVRYYRPVVFSPDGRSLAAVFGSSIRVLDVSSMSASTNLADVGSVRQLAFSPDGRYIAGTSGLGVTIWDAASGVVRLTLIAVPPDRDSGKGGFWFAIRSDGSYNASAGGDVRLRRVEDDVLRALVIPPRPKTPLKRR